MPTVMRVGPYRLFFFSNEGREPAHIHVQAGSSEAKFWLSPVALASNRGFKGHELREIEDIVRANVATLQGAWDAYFRQP